MMNGQISFLRREDLENSESSIEQKFIFDAVKKQLLLDWLEFHFIRDPEFYFGPILSLYYDTPSFRLYNEVVNGDYLKTKIRLRWYQKKFPPEQQTVQCFLEIKQKFGVQRRKRRQSVLLDARCLTGDVFSHSTILELPDALPEWRLHARGILAPLLIVEYERFRFIDPQTDARISLDVGIGCGRANSTYLGGEVPLLLSSGVLEVKSALGDLPRRLRPLGRHLRKDSFSKYATCCGFLLEPSSRWRPL